jgi:hypothetical protein
MLRIRDDMFVVNANNPCWPFGLTTVLSEATHPVETVVLCVRDDMCAVIGDNPCWPFGPTAMLSEDACPVFV